MKCIKCESEIAQQDVSIIYGLRGGMSEILAAGDLSIYFCPGCKIAVLSDKIITQETKLIV